MSAITITSARLDPDNKKVRLVLGTPIVAGNIVGVAYTKGTVVSTDGVSLETFTEKPVTNKVTDTPSSAYQLWGGFKASPISTSNYPYQCIVHLNDDHYDYLVCSKYKLYDDYTDVYITNLKRELVIYIYDNSEWVIYSSTGTRQKFTTITEANNDVYTDQNYTTVRFAKSTS